MTGALALTGADLVRALDRLASPAVDRAARERAEALTDAAEAEGRAARILRRGEGAYDVAVEGRQSAVGSRQSILADQTPDQSP